MQALNINSIMIDSFKLILDHPDPMLTISSYK